MTTLRAAFFSLFGAPILVACGGATQAPPAAPTAPTASMVMGDDTPAGHQQVIDALKIGGHDCENSAKAIACDAKKTRLVHVRAWFSGVADPRRLMHDLSRVGVESFVRREAAPRIDALNARIRNESGLRFDACCTKISCVGLRNSGRSPKSGLTRLTDLQSHARRPRGRRARRARDVGGVVATWMI